MHTLLQSQPVFQACNGLRDRGLANFEITRSGQKNEPASTTLMKISIS
ncbi:MAG: hypothetical protein JWQ42_2993 [Edaphobacter sp.]|nr:hypothetical protein [Edaphobacter sp.]